MIEDYICTKFTRKKRRFLWKIDPNETLSIHRYIENRILYNEDF